MKKVIFVFLVLGFSTLWSQKMTKDKMIELEKKILKEAASYNDIGAYKTALFHLIALEGEHSTYKDTLAELYFRTGEYISLLPLIDELLSTQPENKRYLEMQATAYEKLGDQKKAIASLEKLFELMPGNAAVGYRLAWNQYLLKRIEEAYTTLISFKDQKFPADLVVRFPTTNNQFEQVPLKAAYYNLLGLVTYDLHNLDLAMKYFDEALKVYPDFSGAKQNKEAVKLMKAKLQSKKKGTANKNEEKSKPNQ